MDDRIKQFFDILNCLQSQENGEAVCTFQNAEFSRIDEHHPLADILGKDLCSLPCIFVRSSDKVKSCSRNRRATSRSSKSSVTSQNGSCNISNEVTLEGSPLELQEIAELNGELSHVNGRRRSEVPDEQPLSVQCARTFLSYYHLIHTSYNTDRKKPNLPVWVICDGYDLQHIAYMGCMKIENTIKTIKVHCHGIDANDVVTTQSVKDLHAFAAGTQDMTSSYSAVYEVVKFTSPISDEVSAWVKLEYNWNQAAQILECPLLDAKTKVLARINPGDMSSPADHMYKEFKALKAFAEGLSTQHVCWVVEYRDEPLLDSVKALFKESTDPLLRDAVLSTDGPSNHDDTVSAMKYYTLIEARNTMDFTEKLWEILIECTSYVELQECFRYIVTGLRGVDTVPVVNPKNPTKLARHIKAIDWNKNAVITKLDGLTPLELLVDLGCYKLQQDYLNFFRGLDQIFPEHLLYYEDMNRPVEEQIARLEKLHHCLELTTVLKQNLHLSENLLGRAARLALNHYTTNDVDSKHVFEIPVPAMAVRVLTQTNLPSVWEMTVSGKCQWTGLPVQTLCHASTVPLIRHILLNPGGNDDDDSQDTFIGKSMYETTKVTESYHSLH